MAGANNNGKKVVKPTTNVHVVVFSCPDCTHEIEKIEFCSKCGKPMKVINVIEKFGEEAEEFIKKVREEVEEVKEEIVDVDDAPTIIKLSEEDHIEEEPEDSGSLGVIFPDSDDDQSNSSLDGGADMDFMEALDQLDEEDDAEDPGLNELPEL